MKYLLSVFLISFIFIGSANAETGNVSHHSPDAETSTLVLNKAIDNPALTSDQEWSQTLFSNPINYQADLTWDVDGVSLQCHIRLCGDDNDCPDRECNRCEGHICQ